MYLNSINFEFFIWFKITQNSIKFYFSSIFKASSSVLKLSEKIQK